MDIIHALLELLLVGIISTAYRRARAKGETDLLLLIHVGPGKLSDKRIDLGLLVHEIRGLLVFLDGCLVCRLKIRNCFCFLSQQSVGSLNVLQNDLIIVRKLLELGTFKEELEWYKNISLVKKYESMLASYFSPGLEPEMNLRDRSWVSTFKGLST